MRPDSVRRREPCPARVAKWPLMRRRPPRKPGEAKTLRSMLPAWNHASPAEPRVLAGVVLFAQELRGPETLVAPFSLGVPK